MPRRGRPPEFRDEDKVKMLLWSDRHCCLCKKACGTDIEIAHIDADSGNDMNNGIPLCYNCHAEIALGIGYGIHSSPQHIVKRRFCYGCC